jgi:Tfp pilus assembly protein PilE
MKNNKGFTLIELLSILIILAVVALITIPIIIDSVKEARWGAYRNNLSSVVKATELYLINNTEYLPSQIGDTIEISINDLQNNDLLKKITTPLTPNNECTGYVLVSMIGLNEYDYRPYLNCENGITNSIDDKLVALYKFDDFQESTENGIISPNFSGNIGGYNGIAYERIEDSQSLTGYALKIEHYGVENHAARVRFNVKEGYDSGVKVLSVYAKAEGDFIGRNLQTYTGENWYTFEGGSLTNYYKRFWLVAPVGTESGGPLTVSTRTVNNGVYYVHSPQIEKKTIATPFVESTRQGIVKDYSLNNNNSVMGLENSPKWVNEGKLGTGAYQFNGTTYIETPLTVNQKENYSISLWLYVDESFPNNKYNRFIGTQDWGPGRFGIMTVNGTLSLNTYFGSGYDYWMHSTVVVPRNKWVHVAATFDRQGEQKLYYNGKLVVSKDMSPAQNINWSGDNIRIACGTSGSYYYEPHYGKIDNVAIYNRVLTNQEIEQIYNSEK